MDSVEIGHVKKKPKRLNCPMLILLYSRLLLLLLNGETSLLAKRWFCGKENCGRRTMESLAQKSCNTINQQHTEGRPREMIIKQMLADRPLWISVGESYLRS